MSEIFATLHDKQDNTIDIYPNIKGNNIPNGAITTAKIDDEAITTAKIDDGAITTAKIDDGAITTAKIDDGAITTAKIDDEAITTAKIEDGAITETKIGVNVLNRCLYKFHNTTPSFNFEVEILSKYRTLTIADIFTELYRQTGEIFPCCRISDDSLSGFGHSHGYFNGDDETIEFTDSGDETFNIYTYNLTLIESKLTSIF